MIAVGLGGSECHLDTITEVFATADVIRVTAQYTPSLRAGTTVTLDLRSDGTEAKGYPATITFDVATSCVFGDAARQGLPAGHYRLDVVPDTAPAIGAEFDVK
jgi:hypothetical protein